MQMVVDTYLLGWFGSNNSPMVRYYCTTQYTII